MLDGASELYQAVILDRGRQPRHGRRLDVFDAEARGHNALCGDRCHVFVRRADDGRVAAIGFEARGCAISIASADLMAEATLGLDADGVRRLAGTLAALARTGPGVGVGVGAGDAPAALLPLAGLHAYPSRIKCAMLPWDALCSALDGARDGQQESLHG